MPHQKSHVQESTVRTDAYLQIGGSGVGDSRNPYYRSYPVHLYSEDEVLPSFPPNQYQSPTNPHQHSTIQNGHQTDEEAAASALLIAAGGQRHNGGSLDQTIGQLCTTISPQSIASITVEDEETLQKSNTIFRRQREDESCIDSSIECDSNFPFQMHKILTNSDFAGSTLEWLPHGKSWRVLRWDEFSNNVIPKYFPSLCSKEKRSTSDRMNAFLNHLKIWGFEEVREVGPNMGSYKNEFFIRISPELCKYMKTETQSEITGTNVVSPPRQASSRKCSSVQSINFDSGYQGDDIQQKRRKLERSFEIDDANIYRPTPLHHTGSRFVSFQEQENGEIKKEERIESPTPSPYFYKSEQQPKGSDEDTSRDHDNAQSGLSSGSFPVGESTDKYWEPITSRGCQSLSNLSGLKSNRGGSRASRYNTRDRREPRTQSFSVSNRGRGSRGRR